MSIIIKKSRLPAAIKIPVRIILSAYWAVRFNLDRLLSIQNKHIVICGYPRGGTSLLYNMLSASLEGFYFDEFESRVVERLHRYGNYASKMPLDVLDLNLLSSLNKFSKDICVLIVTRDVRDIITSRHPNIPNEYFIGYGHSWWPTNKTFSNWEYTAPGIGDIYQAINSSDSIKGLRVLKVKYENLVSNVDDVQAEIEGFLGLTFSRKIKEFNTDKSRMAYRYEGQYKAKDQSLVMEDKPLVATRVGKWRDKKYQQRITQQFTQYPELFDILIRDGYESDRSWFDAFETEG